MRYTQFHMGPFDQAPAPGIYHPDTVSPRDKQLLEELCRPPHWEWARLRQVLITLGMQGRGHYIPAAHRPDTLDIQGFRQTIDDLMLLSAQRRAETSTVWLADRERKTLVRSGITSVGTERRGLIRLQPEPGRKGVQHAIASFHTHPKDSINYFSHTDYFAFLDVRGQILQVVAHDAGIIIAAKTSVTPILTPERVKARLADIVEEHKLLTAQSTEAIIAMNRVVCTEFGLTLYFAPTESRDLATRVEVTK